MTERLFDRGDAALERPISFSELGCVSYDLEFVGDDVARDNARAALLRAVSGPPEYESWMRDETAGSAWDMEVSKIADLLQDS